MEPGRWTREAGTDEIRDEIDAQDDQPGQEPMFRRRHDVLSPKQRPDEDFTEIHQEEDRVDHKLQNLVLAGWAGLSAGSVDV